MARLHRIARLILAKLPDTVMERLSLTYGLGTLKIKLLEDNIHRLGARNPDTVTEWAVILTSYQIIRGVEDLPRLVEAANFFFVNSGTPRFRELVAERGNIPPQQVRNLLSYSLVTIEEIMDEMQSTPSNQAERARLNRLQELPEGAELVYNKNNLQIIKVTSPEAACTLARGTKWCTSAHKTAVQYLRSGPLYVLYEKGKKIGQMHLGKADFQLMDLKDVSLPLDSKLVQALKELRLVLPAADVVVGDFDYQARFDLLSKLFYEGMSTQEQEQFKQSIKNDARKACFFATATHQRFPEGEAAIATRAGAAFSYAQRVLKDRFLLGEPTIAKNDVVLASYLDFLFRLDPKKEDDFLSIYRVSRDAMQRRHLLLSKQ